MSKVMHFSLGMNEFIYNRDICMYQVERYIPGILASDNVEISTFDYIYSIQAVPYRDEVVIFIPLKPTKDIRIKLTITR